MGGKEKGTLRVGEERAAEYTVRYTQKAGATVEFDVKKFCKEFDLVRPDLTRMSGYSLRSIDKWASGEKMGSTPTRRLVEIRRLFDALAEIMEKVDLGEWIKTPNAAFEGSTPLQVIERGESDRIWRMIYLIETGEPV